MKHGVAPDTLVISGMGEDDLLKPTPDGVRAHQLPGRDQNSLASLKKAAWMTILTSDVYR